MKIKKIMLKNFANVSEIEVSLSDKITYLIGENGAGKTTVGLNAVWFVLKGLAKKGKDVLHGERFRFVKDQQSPAVGQLLLYDEVNDINIVIQRKMTAKRSALKIVASDGRELDSSYIEDIFNILTINPEGFAKLSPKEQSLSLGIDTSKFDDLKKIKYEERKEANYNTKQKKQVLENLGKVEKVEKVDIRELIKQRAEIEERNKAKLKVEQERVDKEIQTAIKFNTIQKERKNEIHDLEATIFEIDLKIKKLKQSKQTLNKKLASLPDPKPLLSTNLKIKEIEIEDTTKNDEEILQAEKININYQKYIDYRNVKKEHKELNEISKRKDDELKEIENNRATYLKSCNLPLKNMSIDEDGGLLINNKPFCKPYFSKGEILKLGVILAAISNPKLKYVYIPDSQCLDDKNKKLIFSNLVKLGYQVVAEHVGTEEMSDHTSIILTTKGEVKCTN
jgi:recombinational DNA repair ATPase RecF